MQKKKKIRDNMNRNRGNRPSMSGLYSLIYTLEESDGSIKSLRQVHRSLTSDFIHIIYGLKDTLQSLRYEVQPRPKGSSNMEVGVMVNCEAAMKYTYR